MLGSWSLGDYFKREAIELAMEFLTDSSEGLGLDKEKLSVTVYEGDDQIPPDEEAANIWEEMGIPRSRIHFLPREDNWWGPVGDVGPCGPDTEIFFDVGLKSCIPDCRPGCGCGKYIEIWNLVFMGYNQTTEREYPPLKQKNIDTGMGVERVLQVINGLPSVYETDLLNPIMNKVKEIAQIREPSPEQTQALRVITDHARSSVMVLADDKGLVPSNVEHGYVIRRLVRVAIRRGLQLGIKKPFLGDLIPVITEILGEIYPELRRNQERVLMEITKEEKRFQSALRRGLRVCERILKEKGEITGKDAFMLFQSHGFPLEMTAQIAEENGQHVDVSVFRSEFERHRQISREAAQGRFQSGLADHSEEVIRLHTATHLLHQALRRFVGKEVLQKGSNITRERTRLDVQLDRKLTKEELQQVESWVNEIIQRDLPIRSETMSPEKALKAGAIGLFGEKYGPQVTVYSVGDVSKEICNGPHVKRTGVLGTFRITKQKRIGANTLRIRGVLEPGA
jgi:alanyl-tRNA synthetase